jgi:hypothetical protein
MHAFSPKNPIFCTFLQGGGTTFWQAENGGFRGSGRRAGAARADTFCVTFLVIQKDLQASFPDRKIIMDKFSVEVFFERINDERSEHHDENDIRSLPKGRSPLIYTIYILSILLSHFVLSRAACTTKWVGMMHKNTRETRPHATHSSLHSRNSCRDTTTCSASKTKRGRRTVGWAIFRKIVVADIACLPAPEN